MDKSQPKNELAVKFLKALGKRKPKQKHLELTEKLLFSAVVREQLYFDKQLTKQEANCLLLAAKGLTTNEIAGILEVKKSTVETHRISILRKLSCTTITQAVFEAMRFGYWRTKED